MSSRQFVAALGVVACALIHYIEPPAVAGITGQPPLLIVQQSVRLDEAESAAQFSLIFSRTPDFTTVDADGRRADSFQYEIAPGFTSISDASFENITAIVRGDEIGPHFLPIRSGINGGVDPSPDSGGWGPVRANVRYALHDDTLGFVAPLADLDAPDGLFAYRVFTTNFGDTVSLVSGSSAVGLPPALWVGGGMLLILAVVYLRAFERAAFARLGRLLAHRRSVGQSRAPDRSPSAMGR